MRTYRCTVHTVLRSELFFWVPRVLFVPKDRLVGKFLGILKKGDCCVKIQNDHYVNCLDDLAYVLPIFLPRDVPIILGLDNAKVSHTITLAITTAQGKGSHGILRWECIFPLRWKRLLVVQLDCGKTKIAALPMTDSRNQRWEHGMMNRKRWMKCAIMMSKLESWSSI